MEQDAPLAGLLRQCGIAGMRLANCQNATVRQGPPVERRVTPGGIRTKSFPRELKVVRSLAATHR